MKWRIFGLCALLFAVILGCERAKNNEGSHEGLQPPVAEVTGGGVAKEGAISVANVVVHPQEGEPVVFAVEVAASASERAQGLKGRENLGEKQGMWFLFSEDTQDPFWMKDTPISLDIIFVDKDYKIVDVIEKTTPNSERLLSPRGFYRYALEVAAGTAEKYKIRIGDAVEYRLGPS